MISISPLLGKHCTSVAQLHIACLTSPFYGLPGQRLLEGYYNAVISSEGGCGYIALDSERLLGYICGIWAPRIVRKTLIRRSLFPLVWWGFLQVLVKPTILFDLNARFAGNTHSPESREGYELRPIVVSPFARGSGVAADLVNALLEDAKRRGFDKIHLVAEVENHTARRFYEKQAFQLNGQDRKFAYYEKETLKTD